jgi:hypothetical protein
MIDLQSRSLRASWHALTGVMVGRNEDHAWGFSRLSIRAITRSNIATACRSSLAMAFISMHHSP